jgi:hypothetical protein
LAFEILSSQLSSWTAPVGVANHNSAVLAMSIPPMPLIHLLCIMMTLLVVV